jgi:hypothetical protein
MAIVAAYNFNAFLPDLRVPDKSGYGRHLTLDSGVSLGDGHTELALECVSGGALITYGASDYMASGQQASCFVWVKSLSSTAARRVIATLWRGTSHAIRFLLSNAAGNVAVEYGNITSGTQTFASTTSIRDGAWHQVGFTVDVLSTTKVWRIFVDGVVVASGTPVADLPSDAAGTFTIGRDLASPATLTANAMIDDLRWFNDPVYETEASYFFGEVTNLTVAEYNFDAGTGTAVLDQTLRHNDLLMTANGQWIAGVSGTAVAPIAVGNPAAQGVTLNLYDGTFDRISIMGWVKVVVNSGAATPFISLEEADGTPVVQVFRGSSNGLLFKAWGDPSRPFLDGSYKFGADGVLTTTEYHYFHININPTGWLIDVWNAAGSLIDSVGDSSYGTPPTNQPILEGITTLRIGGYAGGAGGAVAIDDLRIIRNYLNPLAVTNLRTTHVTQEPEGVIPIPEGDFAGAFTFGPATSSGSRDSDGDFAGSFLFGPASASADVDHLGDFATAFTFGPASAEGLTEPEGNFGGTFTFGPADASGVTSASGNFAGSFLFGPAAFSGGAPSAGGDFATTFTFGPGSASGVVSKRGNFATSFRFGPATAGGGGNQPLPFPVCSLDLVGTGPTLGLTGEGPLLSLEASCLK